MVNMRISDIRVDAWIESRFPCGNGEEWQRFVEDIKSRGIVVDLLVTHDGLLLDGHRRLRAAKEVGLAEVPVKQLVLEGTTGWEKTISMAVNLYRRHLNEAQRANLGSSLLRIERHEARKRQSEAGKRGGKIAGKGRPKAVGNGSPQPAQAPRRATEHVAETVDVSRKTLERVEAVKSKDPLTAKEMLDGTISVAEAYRRVREGQAAQTEDHAALGRSLSFSAVAGKYHTVYMDPPWSLKSLRGQASTVGVTEKDLSEMPVGTLAHEDGCHFWLWAPWTAIRSGVIHRLLGAWKLRWVGEFVWSKGNSVSTEWLREGSEVLILAACGRTRLIQNGFEQIVDFKRVENHRKPDEFYHVIEELSLGPRIELFSSVQRPGWDCLAVRP